MIPINHQRQRCLIAVRDAAVRNAVASVLSSAGYHHETVLSRKEFIQSFLQHRPQIVFIEEEFLPRFPHRLLQLFKMAHRAPGVLIYKSNNTSGKNAGYAFLHEGVFAIVEAPLQIDDLGISFNLVIKQVQLIAQNNFYKDLIIQIVAIIPLILMFAYMFFNK